MTHRDRHTRYCQLGDVFGAQRINADRARDVLDALLALILERVRQPVTDVVAHRPGNTDAAGLSERFQARRDIDAIAKDVAALGDDVAEIDADAKPDLPLVGHLRLAVDHPALHLGGAAHRIYDAREFHQQAVAGSLDDAALMLLDLGIDELPAMRLETLVRAFLVRPHQARIARHISGEDRGQTAGRGHGSEAHPAPGY